LLTKFSGYSSLPFPEAKVPLVEAGAHLQRIVAGAGPAVIVGRGSRPGARVPGACDGMMV
jgi:hypothetical protein